MPPYTETKNKHLLEMLRMQMQKYNGYPVGVMHISTDMDRWGLSFVSTICTKFVQPKGINLNCALNGVIGNECLVLIESIYINSRAKYFGWVDLFPPKRFKQLGEF